MLVRVQPPEPYSMDKEARAKLPLTTSGRVMTEMEVAFCQEYVRNGYAQDSAALKAGYSEKFAKKKAYTVVERCKAYIDQLQEKTLKRIGISPKAVKNEIGALAFSNLQDYLMEDPERPGQFRFKPPSQLTREQMAAIKTFGFEVTAKGIEYKYTFHDKRQSLMDLARVLGMVDSKMNMMLLQAENMSVNNYDLSKLPTADLEEIEKLYLKKLESIPPEGDTIEGEIVGDDD